MVRKLKNIEPINEDYKFNEVIINDKINNITSSFEQSDEKDIEKITREVNEAVHKTDIYWESYRSIMTRTILPLNLYRDYIKQYNNFIDAVKHYYYDDNFNNYYLFNNIINSLKTSKANLENVLSEDLFKNVCYPIDKLIDFIKNTFLGDYYIWLRLYRIEINQYY